MIAAGVGNPAAQALTCSYGSVRQGRRHEAKPPIGVSRSSGRRNVGRRSVWRSGTRRAREVGGGTSGRVG